MELAGQYGVDSSTGYPLQYKGLPREAKVIFALLAHRDEHVLKVQVDNIRHYNPNAGIILYNGGRDPDFAKSLNLPICPYSRSLQYGKLTRYMLDVMTWLEETKLEYEYLVNLDNDVLFVKHGFEAYLDETMKDFDCMGWELSLNGTPKGVKHVVVKSMWKEWPLWQPVFQTDHFLRCFNPAQVYRKQIVGKMLASVDYSRMAAMFEHTKVWALEEIFFATLAMACGGRCRVYPGGQTVNHVVHWGKNVTLADASSAMMDPRYYWVHPVKGDALIRMHRWLLSGGKPAKKRKKKRVKSGRFQSVRKRPARREKQRKRNTA